MIRYSQQLPMVKVNAFYLIGVMTFRFENDSGSVLCLTPFFFIVILIGRNPG